MSSYTIYHRNGNRYTSTKTVVERKYGKSLGVFNKTIIPIALVGYEMVIAKKASKTSNLQFLSFYMVFYIWFLYGIWAFLINKTTIPLALVGYKIVIANTRRELLKYINVPE